MLERELYVARNDFFIIPAKAIPVEAINKIHFTGKLMSLGTRLPGGIHVPCKHLQFHKWKS